MNDEEFLEYVLAHSQTEQALFSAEHVKRICQLAGRTAPTMHTDSFVGIPHGTAKVLVEAARARKGVAA